MCCSGDITKKHFFGPKNGLFHHIKELVQSSILRVQDSRDMQKKGHWMHFLTQLTGPF